MWEGGTCVPFLGASPSLAAHGPLAALGTGGSLHWMRWVVPRPITGQGRIFWIAYLHA